MFCLLLTGLCIPSKGVEGAMLAATSFLVFWNITLFEGHAGGRLGHGLLSYLLGYPLYLAVSIVTVLLTIIGLTLFAVSFRKRSAHG